MHAWGVIIYLLYYNCMIKMHQILQFAINMTFAANMTLSPHHSLMYGIGYLFRLANYNSRPISANM